MTTLLSTAPPRPKATLLLAHGAGAPMTSPFLEQVSTALAAVGIATVRFEFAYMAARRDGSARRPPPRMPALEAEFRATLERVEPTATRPLLIGGKSMGGRVASLVANDLYAAGRIAGLVCLGYPFHPSGRPHSTRVAHLATIACPTLIVQGTRDPLGDASDVAGYALSPAVTLYWLADGDHDLKPRKPSGHSQAGHIATAADAIARFAAAVSPPLLPKGG